MSSSPRSAADGPADGAARADLPASPQSFPPPPDPLPATTVTLRVDPQQTPPPPLRSPQPLRVDPQLPDAWDPALAVGEEITACWPEEKISPRQNSYSSCTTGGLIYTTRIRPGETPLQAFDRAYAVVKMMGERLRREKVQSFIAYLDEVMTRVSTGGI